MTYEAERGGMGCPKCKEITPGIYSSLFMCDEMVPYSPINNPQKPISLISINPFCLKTIDASLRVPDKELQLTLPHPGPRFRFEVRNPGPKQ